jgi:general secretion pathway protein K
VRRVRDERGVALLLVLWVTVLLAVIAAGFAASARVGGATTLTAKEETTARALAVAGFEHALPELFGEWDVNTLMEDGQVGFLRLAGGAVADQNGTGAAPRAPRREGTLPGGTFHYRVVDAERKINLNTASRERIVQVLDAVGVLIGADRDVVADSILDWIDEDSLHRVSGAEDDDYRRLSPPYRAKNGPLDTLEELRLVRGVTPELFDALVPLLTVAGRGGINLNTASPTVLQIVVPQIAPVIIAQRNAQPLLRPQAGGIVRSTAFTVEATGVSSSGVSRTVRAVVTLEGVDRLRVIAWNDHADAGTP